MGFMVLPHRTTASSQPGEDLPEARCHLTRGTATLALQLGEQRYVPTDTPWSCAGDPIPDGLNADGAMA
jgi:hypothetical protein